MKTNKNIEDWKKELENDKSGFQTPKAYFDDLENDILSKTVNSKSTSRPRIFHFNSLLSIGLSTAAAIIIALVLWYPNEELPTFDHDYLDDLEQYAYFEEDWIAEEVQNLEIDEEDLIMNNEIENLLSDGVTSDEILDIYISE